MKISLIIPIYNAEAFLPRLFENIEAQGVFKDDEEIGEVIFVNDGSSDDSKAKIQEFGRSHTWVRYIEQKNQGQHIARNTGIKAAKGDYIAFMDQDDAYTVDSLKVMLKGAEQNDADILRGRFSLAKDLEYNKWQLYRCDGSEKSTVECGTDYIIRRNGLHYDDFVWASLYRRSFLVHHGFMFHHLVRYNEDGAFVWQVIPEAKK